MCLKTLLLIASMLLITTIPAEADDGSDANAAVQSNVEQAAEVDAAATFVDGTFPAHEEQALWSEDQAHLAAKEAQYKAQIAEQPDNKKTYAYLAGLYLSNHKTSHAIEAYQEAITHDPENPKLFAAISIAYLHQSKFAMAKTMADQALRLDPSMKQVEKINEYIVAKQQAIEAASKVPAADVSAGFIESESKEPHSMMPSTAGDKPLDAIHGTPPDSKPPSADGQ